jgi:proline iminopeptidase
MRSYRIALALLLSACASKPPPTTTLAPASTSSAPAPTLRTNAWMQPAAGVTLSAHSRGGRDGGPAIIVLHGGPGISHEYTLPLDALATDELRVIGFDQRGVGRSTSPPLDGYGLEHHVEDVEILRKGQGVERVHLLGHSWGGLVAMAYAIQHPDHVASLVLVDSFPPKRSQFLEAQRRFAARVKQLEDEGIVSRDRPRANGPDCSAQLTSVLPAYYADPRHPSAKSLGGSSCRTGVYEVTLLATGDYDLGRELGGLGAHGIEALVVEGAADPFGVDMADHVVDAMPGHARKAILPACGSVPWEECAAPFFSAVRAFLASRAQ